MRENNSSDRISRRNILRLSGTGLALATLPTMGVAAKETTVKPSRVDPNKPRTIRTFLENVYALESEAEAMAAWDQLTDEQVAAVAKMEEEMITIKTETTMSTPSETADDIGTQAIPVSYTKTVYGESPVGRVFRFDHTIEWQIQTSNNYVYNYSASSSGNAGGICWNYKGLNQSSFDSGQTSFTSYRQGKVTHLCAGNIYYPYSRLRSHGDGSGTTLSADSDL